MKAVVADLKLIYPAISIEQAEEALLLFSEKWDKKYPVISHSWHKNWSNIVTLFDYPDDIQKIIYTTNAIESLNRVVRKSINNRKIFQMTIRIKSSIFSGAERITKMDYVFT